MKILDAAIRHDPKQAIDYATLLVGKLRKDGEHRQARAVEAVLAQTAARAVGTTDMLMTPKDEQSNLSTVDVVMPGTKSGTLVLPAPVAEQVQEFVRLIGAKERLLSAGLAAPSRLLLSGPPGTGKTSIAHMIAEELGLPLLTTRSDALVSSLLGQTSRNLRSVFDFARRTPCVLFLDEFDALAKKRSDTQEVGELQRVVIALLENMDALEADSVVVAATNHPHLLDPAVWRRFDSVIALQVPGTSQRLEIWRQNLAGIKAEPRDLRVLAEASDGMSGADIESVAKDAVRNAIVSNTDTLDVAYALRRIARRMWYQDSTTYDMGVEMRSLKEWQPSVFSARALARIYDISTRQVNKAIGSGHDDGEPYSPNAVLGSGVPT